MANVDASIIEIAQKYLACLFENGIVVNTAYLFGSHARGAEDKWSDIDIAVIASNISDDRLEERVRFAKLSSAIDSRIEPVPFRPDTFVDEDPLVWEIKKEGIIIKHRAQ
jgi:predicted nucleotidyltransferase